LRPNLRHVWQAARICLWIVFIGAGATLLRFVFWGSFQFVLPVRSPVNAESVIAVSFLLLLTSPVAGANWSERKG